MCWIEIKTITVKNNYRLAVYIYTVCCETPKESDEKLFQLHTARCKQK